MFRTLVPWSCWSMSGTTRAAWPGSAGQLFATPLGTQINMFLFVSVV
jgi:hypothetical protein